MPLLAALMSEVDELNGHGGAVACGDAFGCTDGALDGQDVASPCAVGEDRGLPDAVADRDPRPKGAEAASETGGQVTDVLGRPDGQADEGPAVGAPDIPDPEFGIEYDHHEVTIADGTDSLLTNSHAADRMMCAGRLLVNLSPLRSGAQLRETATMAHDDAAIVKVADLFDPEPTTWGLRGDPYVWRALREHLSGTDVPASVDEVVSLLYAAFGELVGHDLVSDPASSVYREQHAYGGMSSGMISLDTWRERLIPMLAERARKLLEA
jgi:hypothetical protein